ncbi:glycosyl hydrolase 115 family protein [Oleiagrimonas sp. C23AA]|uniref:glycosyl hydrolase 115 family protein n=1 Tax=Oleiagrimonas sp. C23AA TaxID=2719047 RepID=UPI00141E6D96|nr:glycosyl hydrolase 115 family protein [Oleiagrimonas sp. C23AA]NII09372.1 glycosyl hydrolase [Oleiagrimonas sp. C23AA]
MTHALSRLASSARRRIVYRSALSLLLGLACACGAQAQTSARCEVPAAICTTSGNDRLALIAHDRPVSILVGSDNDAGVRRAAHDLANDFKRVSGHRAPVPDATQAAPTTAIIVGTLGVDARIDRIVHSKHLDTHDVRGVWEGYLMQVVDHPLPGIKRALVIAGADRRGTIFGIYELSRRIGVSPWVWWADVPVRHRDALYIAPGRFADAPKVRYRGLFLNDEDPALGGWMKQHFGGDNHRFYAHVFKLILRLRGNTLWPAMWGDRAFAADDPLNAKLANTYGIVMGTSHHEPMMRAHAEWARDGHGPWDYTRNKKALDAFWRRGIQRMGHDESLVTIGMRGDGDKPMTQGVATHLLERIVADQRRIIASVTGKSADQTPQVWALYKEVQDYYDAGMRVPDDVTLLYSDDNWGHLRRLPPLGAKRQGGYGIYYHFDYVGGPHSYKWINTNQIECVFEQMHMAYAYGARQLWIVNVGDLKPMEFPISFFMDYAWNPQAFSMADLRRYPRKWAAQQFGAAHAKAIGHLLTRYTQYNARRKPEMLSADTFSLTHFHEAARVLAQWNGLAKQARRIGQQLPKADRAAYVELVEYPVLASANLNRMYVAVARNHLYARQGRASANAQAALARRYFAKDAALTKLYEQGIAGGKWNHMMSQAHIGPGAEAWRDPTTNTLPALKHVDVPDAAALGVAVDGDARAWPGPKAVATLPTLDSLESTPATISVFNRGRGGLRFTAHTSAPWLHVQPSQGPLQQDQQLHVRVDWAHAPVGRHTGEITLAGSDGSQLKVNVPIRHRTDNRDLHGFVETHGRVVMEAAHYTHAKTPTGITWKRIDHLGRTLAAMTAWPVTASTSPTNAHDARLDYAMHLEHAGRYIVRVLVSPTLDVLHRGGLRFAVSLDGQAPKVLTIQADAEPGHSHFKAWERAVSHNIYVAKTTLDMPSEGQHTLTLWRIDPGVVFQRIELSRHPLPASYLGPPESPRLPVSTSKHGSS